MNQLVLDNRIIDLLVTAAVIIFVLIFKRFISKPLALIFHLLLHKFHKGLERKEFTELIVKPVGWFLSFMVSLIAIYNLKYPTAWNLRFYNISLHLLLQRLTLSFFIICIIWLMINLVNFSALVLEKRALQTEDKKDDQLVRFTRDLLKSILIILGILLLIRIGLNKNISSLLTGLSIIGAALALAAKETIENLIASFIIFIDKPFTAGDTVKIGTINGCVEHIGLRSSRIRTNEKTLVSVPNKQMVDSIVDNLSSRTERRGEIKLELNPQTSTSKLELLQANIKTLLIEKSIHQFTVHFNELSKNGKTLTIEFFIENLDNEAYNQKKEALNFGISRLMETLHVELSTGASVNIITEGGISGSKSESII